MVVCHFNCKNTIILWVKLRISKKMWATKINRYWISLILYSPVRSSISNHASSNYCVRNWETEKCFESDLHVMEYQRQLKDFHVEIKDGTWGLIPRSNKPKKGTGNSITQLIQGQKEHHAWSNYCVRNRETEKCCESDLHVTENQWQCGDFCTTLHL